MPSPIIIGSITGGTGPRLDALRNLLADELGFRQETVVSTEATHGEKTRVILADEIRDDEAGHVFMGGDPWVYVKDGAVAPRVQRRIVSQEGIGYQGANGEVVLSRPLAGALAVGTGVIFTSPLPVKRHLGILGLDDCLNQGLKKIEVEVRLAVTGNGTYSYDLDAQPWITSQDQLRGIYDTAGLGASSLTEPLTDDSRIVVNGGQKTLVTGQMYSSSQTFYQAVVVPADTLIYDGSAWGYSATPGLVNDAYRTAAPERWALAFGMVQALRQLRKMARADRGMDKQEKAFALAEIADRMQDWLSAAVTIKLKEFSRPRAERLIGLIGPEELLTHSRENWSGTTVPVSVVP